MVRNERRRTLRVAAGAAVVIGVAIVVIAFEELVIEGGSSRLREARLKTDLRMQVDTEPAGPDDDASPIVARGTGRYRNGEFSLSAPRLQPCSP